MDHGNHPRHRSAGLSVSVLRRFRHKVPSVADNALQVRLLFTTSRINSLTSILVRTLADGSGLASRESCAIGVLTPGKGGPNVILR